MTLNRRFFVASVASTREASSRVGAIGIGVTVIRADGTVNDVRARHAVPLVAGDCNCNCLSGHRRLLLGPDTCKPVVRRQRKTKPVMTKWTLKKVCLGTLGDRAAEDEVARQ